jgi:branched-chain amino acid transport system substrate-binding protein
MVYIKEGNDKRWDNDQTMNDFKALIKKYAPEVSPDDGSATNGYAIAQVMAHVLRLAGDNLTRENIMKIATSLKDHQIPMALPGVLASTSADDFALFQTMQLVRFDGTTWVSFGKPQSVR